VDATEGFIFMSVRAWRQVRRRMKTSTRRCSYEGDKARQGAGGYIDKMIQITSMHILSSLTIEIQVTSIHMLDCVNCYKRAI
jgi:hypothetical protein